jgi:uncharacterized protein (TIGR00369 family)
MPVTTDVSAIDAQIHKNCVVCGSANDRGLHVKFIPLADGGVQAYFRCDKAYEGYAGKIHGGVISALLDGAMTHCIFACGKAGVTGELKVRYRHPVEVEQTAIVRGWIQRDAMPLYITEAELIQDGQVKVTATAKFMAQPQLIEKG